MTRTTRRFMLLDRSPEGLWPRLAVLWRRVRRGPAEELREGGASRGDSNVDGRLRQRVAVRAVRAFLDQVQSCELRDRRTVRVLSDYEVPQSAGLADRVPAWIAERIRICVPQGSSGRMQYLPIHEVEVDSGPGRTALLLHLDRPIERGTETQLAAWLGEPNEGAPPPTRLLGN